MSYLRKQHELYDCFEQIREAMGDKALLDAFYAAMSRDEIAEMLEFIDRMHDLDLYPRNSRSD